ncbi:Rv2175c family DNA-binding protein [Sporichthya brevicatena]|uniref:Rv2175c family DNA-binding protein n=1 Tax=Sporichthya brevicatena TaxID=171442 RepID=A0ABN1GZN5_9ACTN
MSETQDGTDVVEAAVSEWLTVPDVAERLGTDVIKVRALLKDRQLLARRRGERDVLSIPAEFVQDGPDGPQVLKGLPGTLVLLADARYSDEEALRWLFTADDTLPGTPVDALRANRGTEVRRRAQALGF